ncbi:MAG: hypothetical protein Q4C47_04765 [Planctomycetia bacterium]|nr:hypothetical protein [Planctomycetia bacterium]
MQPLLPVLIVLLIPIGIFLILLPEVISDPFNAIPNMWRDFREKGLILQYDQAMEETMTKLDREMQSRLEKLRESDPDAAAEIDRLVEERKSEQERSYVWCRSPKWNRQTGSSRSE